MKRILLLSLTLLTGNLVSMEQQENNELLHITSQPLDSLPEELLLKILSYLNVGDFAHTSRVNKQWNNIIQNDVIPSLCSSCERYKDTIKELAQDQFKMLKELTPKQFQKFLGLTSYCYDLCNTNDSELRTDRSGRALLNLQDKVKSFLKKIQNDPECHTINLALLATDVLEKCVEKTPNISFAIQAYNSSLDKDQYQCRYQISSTVPWPQSIMAMIPLWETKN